MNPPVCLGDPTTHGGVVKTASSTFNLDGRKVALWHDNMDFWRPDNRRKSGVHERDNHGRLYVYFTPHDRVMGATPLQSIGWQGLPDKLLSELGDTVKQRMLARGTPVGDAPGVKKFGTLPLIQKPVPGVKPDAFWNGNRRTPLGDLWATPHPDKTVTVNAEEVPHPVTAGEMKTFEDSRVMAPEMAKWVKDPVNPNKGQYADPDYRFFRSIYQPEWKLDANPLSPIGVSLDKQTQDEMLQQHDHYHAEPPNHSTVPERQDFMRRVVAYDLPVGFCDAYERPVFWTRLMQLADWTLGYDTYFQTGVPKTVEKPKAIDWDTASGLNEAAIKKLNAQAKGLSSTKREDIVYGD
ncbi:T6SS effector phospholipase Tle3 domain-containing protein [Paraburkholderia kururiensis]|uniref:T6SS effector phospholipase Tle3 domain-containing protein n=1 Tax=Paraburkholderia kururiensis TaxID=984307 RepID=UPI001F2B93FA|nr:DUF3274 domain-containing protein [Paraburkholderia kururiensis]